jgi:hypothetical protein
MDKKAFDEMVENYKPCVLCKSAFGRIRLTNRYCYDCGNAFCDGEHGNFAKNVGKCVICGAPKSYLEGK